MIRTKLMPHQEAIVRFMWKREYGGIFSDYGTGKTLCALCLMKLGEMQRVLVVSTKTSIMSTWPNEIRAHTNFPFIQLLGTRKKKLRLLRRGLMFSRQHGRAHYYNPRRMIVFLVNFDGVKNIAAELSDVRFDGVFVDESTKIKSPKADRTKVMWALGKNIQRRFILTGFPVTEGLHEIYSQIKFLDGGRALGNSYSSFLNTCFVRMGTRTLPKRDAPQIVLSRIKDFCIRITNESLKLPPKIYKEMVVEQSPKQRFLLSRLNDEFRLELGRVKIDTQYIFTLLMKSMQICDGFVTDSGGNLAMIPTEKDQALVDILEDIDPRKNKVVIWANFKFSVLKIATILKRMGYPVLVLTGETEQENLVIKKFQVTRDQNILVATQKKAAESITLTACRYAIYYSNNWSYDNRSNSEARIRRKGSEIHSSIMYIDLVTKGTIERNIYRCLRNKANLVKDLQSTFLSTMGKDKRYDFDREQRQQSA